MERQKQRTTKACDSCSQKRRKCSGLLPCEYCSQKNLECTYNSPTRKRGPQSKAKSDKDYKEVTPEPVKAPMSESSSSATSFSNLADAHKYTLVNPLVPPKYNPNMIPLEDVEPTLSRWNRHNFPPVQIDEGKTAPWLDVFFQIGHPIMPILSPSWFYQNYDDIPMYLLHAMYAVALTYPLEGQMTYNTGDYHFACCRWYHSRLTDPNPFDIMATMLMGIYALMSTDALLGGISKVRLAIQMAQDLNLGSVTVYRWYSPEGREFGNDYGTGKIFLRMLWHSLYQNDYYFAFVQNLPCQLPIQELQLEFPPQVPNPEYNTYHTSGIWYYHCQLLSIGKKMLFFSRQDFASLDPAAYVAAKDELADDLHRWLKNAPPIFSQKHQAFSFDFLNQHEPHWMIAYLQCYYYHLYIMLQRLDFLSLMESQMGGEYHPAVRQVLDYSLEITRIIKICHEKNPKFIGMSAYMFYIMYLAATSFCIAVPVLGRQDWIISSVNQLIEVCDSCGTLAPVMKLRANMIRNWLIDPGKYSQLYAQTI